MFDPDGDRKELAEHPGVDRAIAVTLTLQDIPPELILHIASLLKVRDLLALRGVRFRLYKLKQPRTDPNQSNRSIYNLTQDRILWSGLLRDLHLPLPRTLRSRRLDSLSYLELKEAVLNSCRVEDQWLKRRDPRVIPRTMFEYADTILLDFLDDRWIISIPKSGQTIIRDAQENPPKLCKWTSNILRGGTQNAVATVDPHQGDIIIVAWE